MGKEMLFTVFILSLLYLLKVTARYITQNCNVF